MHMNDINIEFLFPTIWVDQGIELANDKMHYNCLNKKNIFWLAK